jgi:hypothetical protein
MHYPATRFVPVRQIAAKRNHQPGLKLATIKIAIRKTGKIIGENCLGTRSLSQKGQKGAGKTGKRTESGSSHVLWVLLEFELIDF